jgi:multisubunit Na+/H+ antiporter MnhC subunit
MVFMIFLLRYVLQDLKVLCLLLLGLGQRGHRVVMPNRVLVIGHMAMDPVAVALVLTSQADHDFLIVVISSPFRTLDVCCFP